MTPIDPDIFAIDQLRLDEEWIGQPKLFFAWAATLAEAKLEHAQAETALDVCKADLDYRIRQSPENYGLNKVTEPGVKAAILGHKKYVKAADVVHQSKYRVDIVQAAVTALDHRKRALQDLVALHGQNYFAVPQAPKGTEDAVRQMEGKAIYRKSKQTRGK